jgi:DNA polymerase
MKLSRSGTQPPTQASLSIDLETCSPLALPKVGAHKYSECPDTVIVCMAYKFDDEPIELWSSLDSDRLPDRVIKHAANGGKLCAFNAGFEMLMLSGHCGKKIGWPKTKISQWHDSAAKVAAHGLPRSLGNAALTLPGIPHKDETGKREMLKLAKPAWLAKATPEQLAALYSYCKQDVLVEHSIDQVLPDLSPYEQVLWEVDYQINKRGFLVDLDLVGKIQKLIATYVDVKVARCLELTGARPSQRAVIMAWCCGQGYIVDSYTADDIKEYLRDKEIPPQVREALEIRQATAFAAVKKYAAFELTTCADSRLRGMFLYHGAGTSRWTGRGAQLHNLSRPVLLKTPEAIAGAIKRVQAGVNPVDLDKQVLPAFKDLVRSVLTSPIGHTLEVSDFSSVEARVLGWMANDPIYQKAFAEDLDLYIVTASMIYGVPYAEVTDDQRFLGKAAVLGLGYSMGSKKFIETVAKTGRIVPDDLIIRAHAAYRETYKAIVKMWSAFGDASLKVVSTGVTQRVGKCVLGLKTHCKGTPQEITFMYVQKPGGGRLAYYSPKIEMVATPWGEKRAAFTALVLNEKTRQLERNPVHGGLLAQHATQGIARDLLANGLIKAQEHGVPVVGHVHDEIIAEMPKDGTPQLPDLMTDLPDWAQGLNVKAHGFVDKRYRK